MYILVYIYQYIYIYQYFIYQYIFYMHLLNAILSNPSMDMVGSWVGWQDDV